MSDGTVALDDINFTLAKGARLSILGPSGSGKTTLLRLISGLETPDCGSIEFNGHRINDEPAYKRNFGLMFQDYALFPHLDVSDNIAFGLKMRGQSSRNIKKRVTQLLELTDLTDLEHRRTEDLSGGERQRVALARTLAPKPSLLMLDEPLSSLDRVLRKRLLSQLTRILSAINTTTIFVTHDHKEALAAGDILMIMNQGKIEQMGTCDQVINNPKNNWVAQFLE